MGGPVLPSSPLGISFPNARGAPTPGGKFVSVHVFNDLVCPFSRKSTLAMIEWGHKLAATKPVEFVYHPMPQPWHPQSPILHEAALAVRQLEGDEGYMRFIAQVLEESTYATFQDIEAYDKSRTQLHRELAGIYAKVFSKSQDNLLELLKYMPGEPGARNSGNAMSSQLKLHIRYARRLGVHVSPTVFINGTEATQVSSSWTMDQWAELIDQVVA